ncbi:MAG: nucleoside deaminase [Gammaproteobacteria bacterium]|nr:nucleoside deaminase [Gammaproteobacteria bacterium]
MDKDDRFMLEALRLARQGVEQRHGGPFGAVVVVDDEILGRGWNQVVARNDPTAHAEILAIRDACARLGQFHLERASLYSTCEPCPMCLAATHWARIGTLVFAADAEDAARLGFHDKAIMQKMHKPLPLSGIQVRRIMQDSAQELFELWQADQAKTPY